MAPRDAQADSPKAMHVNPKTKKLRNRKVPKSKQSENPKIVKNQSQKCKLTEAFAAHQAVCDHQQKEAAKCTSLKEDHMKEQDPIEVFADITAAMDGPTKLSLQPEHTVARQMIGMVNSAKCVKFKKAMREWLRYSEMPDAIAEKLGLISKALGEACPLVIKDRDDKMMGDFGKCKIHYASCAILQAAYRPLKDKEERLALREQARACLDSLGVVAAEAMLPLLPEPPLADTILE